MSILRWIPLGVALLLHSTSADAASPFFQRLDPVRGDGAVHVSGDGRVVVWTTTNSIVYRQVVGQTAVSIGDLPGGIASTVARDVDYDGDVIVGSSHSGWPNHEAFRWTLTGGIVGLGDFFANSFSVANATSDDGSVVVGFADQLVGGTIGFLWRFGALESLPLMREAGAVNADGTAWTGDAEDDPTVVAGVDASNSDPIWWTLDSSVEVALPPGGGPNAEVRALSREGWIMLFNRSIPPAQGHYWTCGSLTDCANGTGVFTTQSPESTWTMTPDASLTVGRFSTPGGYHAALWEADGTRHDLNELLPQEHSIDLEDCILSVATDISHDGKVITGIANCPGIGNSDGWVARLSIPPIPVEVPALGPWALLGLGLALATGTLARRLRPA